MLSKGDWCVRPGDGEGDFCEALDALVQHIVNHCATHYSNYVPTPVPQVCIKQANVSEVSSKDRMSKVTMSNWNSTANLRGSRDS
jgi:hypothetical protein